MRRMREVSSSLVAKASIKPNIGGRSLQVFLLCHGFGSVLAVMQQFHIWNLGYDLDSLNWINTYGILQIILQIQVIDIGRDYFWASFG